VRTCFFPAPQPTGRHLALDQLLGSARRPARRRGLCACQAAARAAVNARASHPLPTFDHPSPLLGPIRAATTTPLAGRSDPSNPVRQPWPVLPHRPPGSSVVRTARRQRPRPPDARVSGHPDHPGRVDTGRVDTGRLDTGRLDTGDPPDQVNGRPSARRTADADSATNGVASVKTSWTATTTAMPAGRPQPGSGCGVCGACSPCRLRVPTPAAAVPGQPRSTARHEAAPRRTAVMCWSWRVRGEGNGTKVACTGSGLVRECWWVLE
jgi:hypothetical protein